ncbi:hypothetical protein SAMN04488028_105185 [Reichenbachiella agariperforans]|uniref:DUF1648 domain-containing protein n=1 Tax=Reichenbachiella agariperforans TaxID=156994 RepID=A0A1M6SWM3_REIAG|nr:hypothetical protein [Reichenbachiella agariperforans]SHK49115.1 hypothetical protein SAMN04488028_105185 [Reichenbachiella agariperforans]
MVKAIKFCYLISVPIFLIVLLYYYALFPAQIDVYFNASGLATHSVDKSMLFYLAIGVFVVTNGLIFLYRRLKQSEVDMDLIDFGQMTKSESMYHWINGLSLMFNVTYILSIIYLGLFQSRQNLDITDYTVLVYLGPIFIILWIFWFLYLQITKK